MAPVNEASAFSSALIACLGEFPASQTVSAVPVGFPDIWISGIVTESPGVVSCGGGGGGGGDGVVDTSAAPLLLALCFATVVGCPGDSSVKGIVGAAV